MGVLYWSFVCHCLSLNPFSRIAPLSLCTQTPRGVRTVATGQRTSTIDCHSKATAVAR
jgi:hypothetical protein